jgi:hypothetical protein
VSAHKRTLLLGVTAVVVVVLLALDQLGSGGTDTLPEPTPEREATKAVDPPVPGSPAGLDVEALRARYRPVRDARPFARRSFLPKPPPSPGEPVRPRPRPSAEPASPTTFQLRLTGIVREGGNPVAVLEERGTGRGLLVQSGLGLGEVSVAEVSTSALVVMAGGTRNQIELGASLSLPLDLRTRLVALKPAGTRTTVTTGSSGATVEISEEARQSVLERLRARRRASLRGPEGKGGD